MSCNPSAVSFFVVPSSSFRASMDMRRMTPASVSAFSALSSSILQAAILSRAELFAASLAMSVRIVTASVLSHPFSARA